MTTTKAAPKKASTTTEATSWQDTLAKSTALKERGAKQSKQAGILLWTGAKSAIEEYQETGGDPSGEEFYSSLVEALGTNRKSDASKIKTVALAVESKSLDLAQFPNLAKAYAEAIRLTTVAKKNEAEDNAADEAIQKIAVEAPKSSSKPEGAIQIALAGGADDFARLVVDAVVGPGEHKSDDLAAARAILRALQQEIAGRIAKPEPKPKAAKDTPKSGATKAKTTAKSGATKAKPATKGKPSAQSVKEKMIADSEAEAKAKADEVVEDDDLFEDEDVVEETVEDVDDLFDALDDDEVDEPAPVKKAPVKRPGVKGRPIKRG